MTDSPADVRRICIHGHFYQPPRENAWLEEIETQDSARPYHDWNERVAAECYGPNSASRILDGGGKISDIVNNYSRISFNFGPTLLSWLEKHEPEVYASLLRADKESAARFSGHGGAIAQCYSHMIMPLANARDKRTQVVWGIFDFERRFGRKPEGMWLPETAVDPETLDIMAELGIKFTLLAPHQARSIRKKGEKEWRDIPGSGIDPRRPYACPLPSGRSIAVFFYDGPIAHDIAFGGLLDSGEAFAKRLAGAFVAGDPGGQIVHIATDGETYGHHHRFGDMALAYCLHLIEAGGGAKLTIYGEHLEKNPPAEEVRIAENTSWSCGHGVERWRANCGDNSGQHPGWQQAWRAPLREAMDWLRDQLAPFYEREMKKLVRDPWQAREDYIGVISDRSPANVDDFFSRRALRPLSDEETSTALRLLEMQRHAMLMFTSDGWFFDDISGIETVQVLQYAARAMQLAHAFDEDDWESGYLAILAKAASNVPELGDGRKVYRRFVKPAALDLLRVGAHYAVSSLFEKYSETTPFGCFTARGAVTHLSRAGRQKVAVGKVHVSSEITRTREDISFAVLHLGDHNVMGGVHRFQGDEALEAMWLKIEEAFDRSDVSDVVGLMDKYFGSHSYSLWHLFQDEKRKVIAQILGETLGGIEASFHRIYEDNYPMMLALKDMEIPLPSSLAGPLQFTLNKDLETLLLAPDPDLEKIERVAAGFADWALAPDRSALGYLATVRINAVMAGFAGAPTAAAPLLAAAGLIKVLAGLRLDIDLWKIQNVFFFAARPLHREMEDRAGRGDPQAAAWLSAAAGLAGLIGIGLG